MVSAERDFHVRCRVHGRCLLSMRDGLKDAERLRQGASLVEAVELLASAKTAQTAGERRQERRDAMGHVMRTPGTLGESGREGLHTCARENIVISSSRGRRWRRWCLLCWSARRPDEVLQKSLHAARTSPSKQCGVPIADSPACARRLRDAPACGLFTCPNI